MWSYSYTKYQQNSIYSEFYRGLDFLKEINFQNDFGWAGILVNRSILNEMKIFKSSIISLDYIANLKLLLKGNICFNKNLSYNLIIHNENASLKNYNYSQSKLIIKEIKEILSHVEKIASEQDFSIIKIKFKNHYIKNIYNFHYINDRNNRLIFSGEWMDDRYHGQGFLYNLNLNTNRLCKSLLN